MDNYNYDNSEYRSSHDNQNENKTLIKVIILLVLVILILILFIIIRNNYKGSNNSSRKLLLHGDSIITLNLNDKYEEPGFVAYNEKGIIDIRNVKVDNTKVDTSTPGTYTITYTYGNIEKTRTIKVLEEDEKVLTLELLGDSEISLYVEDEFIEPGYTAKYGEEDVTDRVETESNLNLTKPGEYEIIYSIYYKKNRQEVIRHIKVIDDSLKIILNNNETAPTNEDISVDIEVEGETFVKLLLPNNEIIEENETSYTITENGTYTFKAYNEKGKEFEEAITITNIDKEPPSGTCKATLNKKNTEIIVDAKDNNIISNYTYYDKKVELKSINSEKYIHDKKTSKIINVSIIDNATNKTDIKCEIIDNSYDKPILPKESEKIEVKIETDTLKAYISKFSSYYLTRIWMLDPYNQANKVISPEFGKKLYKPKTLLEKEIANNKLENKAIIGFNASGFYLKGTYDASSVKRYSGYNKTSVGTLVIANGKVVRNAYDKGDVVTWFITGIDKDNQMVIFEDTKAAKKYDSAAKKKWADTVINSGIRNTYTFAAPVILNGKKTSYTNNNSRMPGSNSSSKGLQMMCQINDNNFLLFTARNATRNTAISKFLELGCKTAVNLDGGGSVALLYKTKDSKTVQVKTGNGRALPETGYFIEGEEEKDEIEPEDSENILNNNN